MGAAVDLSRGRGRQREHGIDRLRIARGAQLLGDVLVAQQTCDAGQRLEMIGAGAFRREQEKTRSTGWPSIASKSIGRSSRANRPKIFSSLGSLPCGMATPYPTAVVPSFSRCNSTSKTARSFCPVSSAALAASSCKACFLLLTFNAGRNRLGRDQIGNRHESLPR